MTGNLDELRKEFHEKRKELSKLRSQISSVNSQKEEIFKQLRSSKDKIASHLQQIRSITSQRDELTKKVKEFKEERNKLNQDAKEKLTSKKNVEVDKKNLVSGFDRKQSPSKILSEIKMLEEKIEIEVIPFSKEKEIRKRIKELKSEYNKIKEVSEKWKNIDAASADFTEARKKAEVSHQKVKEAAYLSQEKHEEVNKLYGSIRDLKKSEAPLAEKYLQFKTEHNELKNSFEGLKKRVDELAKLFNEDEHKSFKEKVREKTAEVKDKIKKKQKLKMEDILMFQASKE